MSFTIEHGLFKFDIIDHYAILGLAVNANPKGIRKRYLKIAHKLHPDTCKVSNDAEKQQASQILSKLVNPAYEQLSKDKTRSEYQVVLSQIGQRLAGEGGKITIASEPAKILFKAESNLDIVYKKLLTSLATDQYNSLGQAIQKITQLSELNLVFLILKQGEGIKEKIKQPATIKTANKTSQVNTSNKDTYKQEDIEPKSSPVSHYIRRAQEYLEKNNCAKAILEVREALKLDPNNNMCHRLIGLAYLRQKQIGMARVHINKAWQANPKDPLVIKLKKELDRLDPKADSRKGSLFGSFFGSKKK